MREPQASRDTALRKRYSKEKLEGKEIDSFCLLSGCQDTEKAYSTLCEDLC